jgi:hypothetical protein
MELNKESKPFNIKLIFDISILLIPLPPFTEPIIHSFQKIFRLWVKQPLFFSIQSVFLMLLSTCSSYICLHRAGWCVNKLNMSVHSRYWHILFNFYKNNKFDEFFLPLFTPNDFKQENVVYGFIDNKSYVHDLCMWMVVKVLVNNAQVIFGYIPSLRIS